MRSVVRFAAFVFVFTLVVPNAFAYRMSAWVPSWDPNAVPILNQHAGALAEANPGWYTAVADGSISKNWGSEDNNLRAALAGVELFPTIKNYIDGFDGQLVATIVSSAALREKHAETITALVVANAYDGIDIDYESVPATSRANFTAFIELLASKLHAAGKGLSVTVHAKTGESTRNGPGAQDWVAIGAVADTVKIMAYDKHWSTSDAGALAPLDWLDAVASYAGKTIPAQKIIIGLPWYGYDWYGKNGESVTFAEATERAKAAGATITHESTGGEAFFMYNGRMVYFQDAEAYRRKVEWLTGRHAIGGFAAWRVGAEDPAIWDIVNSLQNYGSTPVEQPKKDFAISGPAEVRMTAGTSGTATFSYVAINGFDEQVTVTANPLDPFAGTVTFSAPRISRATSTTMTVNAPAAGTYRFAVTMTGTTATHEQVVAVVVVAPPPVADFALVAPEEVTLASGRSAALSFALTPKNGFNGTVQIAAHMLDAFPGAIRLTSSTLAPNGSVTLTLTAPPHTARGTYRLELYATSGSITRTRVVNVVVTPSPKRRSVH